MTVSISCLRMEVHFLESFDIKMTVAYACDLNVYVCVNFMDKILLRGEECKT